MGSKTRGHSTWEKLAKALAAAEAEKAERRSARAPAKPAPASPRWAPADSLAHVKLALAKQRASRAASALPTADGAALASPPKSAG